MNMKKVIEVKKRLRRSLRGNRRCVSVSADDLEVLLQYSDDIGGGLEDYYHYDPYAVESMIYYQD